jgi:hypothetical protein
MPITVSGTSITFNDATVQTTAAAGGFGGATTTTSAVDITLTNTSTQTQVVSMTAADKSVILPSATTLSSKGGPIYIIQNKGQFPFFIKNNAGTVVYGPVMYGQSIQLALTDNSTAAGTWTQTNITNFVGVGPLNISSLQPDDIFSAPAGPRVAVISATQAVIFYIAFATPTVLRAVLATVSGTTVTYGTPVTVLTNAQQTAQTLQAVGLSSTLAVVTTKTSAAGGTTSMIAVSISGSTLTAGTAVATGAASYGYSTYIYPDTATTGVVAYGVDDLSGNSYSYVRGFSVAGTTVTFGTAVALYTAGFTGGSTAISCTKLATGSYVALMQSYNARTFTISGTTITAGTNYSLYSTSSNSQLVAQGCTSVANGVALTSTCAMWSYGYASFIINTSGTTVTSTLYNINSNTSPLVSSTISANALSYGSNTLMINDLGGNIYLVTGNATQFGGPSYASYTNMRHTTGSAMLDSTTMLVAGVNNGFLTTAVAKVL